MHESVPVLTCPIEFINVTPVNPLISRCQIKVCYVGDKPNRNRSIITKEAAKKLANSLPGSPIVGYYNENTEDFEEHNRTINISNGKFEVKDTTRPYGFVDLNAKCWFQKYQDDNSEIREYLVTEGYLWTGQYPECERVITKGNNQSMELSNKMLDATWTKDDYGMPEFFIINEAIIEKLCILGQDCEPCFEGANITEIQFSLDEGFKEQLFSMMKELKDLLNEGGSQMLTTYSVEIGDSLWSALWNYTEKNYPDANQEHCSAYSIEGVFEENEQKFAVLQNRADNKYYRLNFSINEDKFEMAEELIEFADYTPAEEPQFALDKVVEFENNYKAAQEPAEEDKAEEEVAEVETEAEEAPEEDSTKADEPAAAEESVEEETEEAAPQYSLDNIPEYQDIVEKYAALEERYNALMQEKQSLEDENVQLTNFKKQTERKDKEAMIASFYMLSDEDKKDVVDNIDTYSLNDIEAQLSIICVRNKVSFNLDEETDTNAFMVYNLNQSEANESTPAWVQAVLDVAKSM